MASLGTREELLPLVHIDFELLQMFRGVALSLTSMQLDYLVAFAVHRPGLSPMGHRSNDNALQMSMVTLGWARRTVFSPLKMAERVKTSAITECGGTCQPTAPLLAKLASLEWAARSSPSHIVSVRFSASKAWVTTGDGTAKTLHGPLPIAASRNDVVRLLARPASLPVPKGWSAIPFIPNRTAATQDLRLFWAYLLIDLSQYEWAIREQPYHLWYELIELLPEAAVVSVQGRSGRWVSVIPLPPAGDTVGMPFEIRDWTEAAGIQIAPGTWLNRIDKYDTQESTTGSSVIESLRRAQII